MSDILIFSRPIRSGKTTELRNALPNLPGCEGILCPDREGLRRLYCIAEDREYPFQVAEAIPGQTTEIGRFHFTNQGFEKARSVLEDAASQIPAFCIVDEIGKLEIRRKSGLEPAVSKLIEAYRSSGKQATLVLVVRDFLLEEVRNYYDLYSYNLISQLEPWLKNNLV